MALNTKSLKLKPVGVLDIGSNSIRLVVYQSRSRALMPVFNERVICGIGRGLQKTGRLDPKGVKRALKCLPRFAALTKAMDIKDLNIFATAATREAQDGRKFIFEVEKLFKKSVKQLDAQQETRLGANGIICGMPDADGITGDLGGGSLELARVDKGVFKSGVSLPLGHLRLLSDLGSRKVPLKSRIDSIIEEARWLSDMSGLRFFYAFGGAWRAIARLHIAQSGYPLSVVHNYSMKADVALDFCQVIGGLSQASLPFDESISSQRAESLPVAALIMHRLIRELSPHEVVFSALGVREGVLFDRLKKSEKASDPLIIACHDIAIRESRFMPGSNKLFNWVAPLFIDEGTQMNRLRLSVCLLADIGWHEHPDYRAEQVFFRILRLPLIAVTHEEKATLALAVYRRYGGNMESSSLSVVNKLLDVTHIDWSTRLGNALRLAETLSGGQLDLLDGSSLRASNRRVHLEVDRSISSLVSDVVRKRLSQLAAQMNKSHQLSIK
ncbi:MAG: exopolyphosphatase [Alphaproteobacteria bacterium]|mgnify:CR=1 FL=1|jgi:exopolyphosphatase/guanosine-5'-triphosphate,3'-diphosphate pyrophosphatase|nr:exopolyphosphatase [Alphaproteobacteria bacterium]PPR13497.1 MAG: hypothetical protein CFH42_01249 [Alphaproteobacteria bacterium MarineAlpha12_Bin1]|tara:strand:+ start:18698 stop:20191 length:1494 start_codon:yes stop_codon:yes gene_type:complete